MEWLRENGRGNAGFEAYVYVNVNHSDLALETQRICPNKKAAVPKGAAALSDST
jgi:hypothetical protein